MQSKLKYERDKAMKEKMWCLLVHLSDNQWVDNDIYPNKKPIIFDDTLWTYILEKSVDTGINTIVLDVGDGVIFDSYPEIAAKGAWTKERVKTELKRCRDLGITLIPKLNFATTHDHWLGEYSRMISTKPYYEVVKALIEETYELFEKPEYFHIGMDEEDELHVRNFQYALYRQGELYWHDLEYIVNCVKSLGATPWMWADPLFDKTEEYPKHFEPDEILLSPWYYNSFRKEHYTPIESRAEYVTYYNEGNYAKMGIKYVEEDPFLVNVREKAIPLSKKGYKYVPCASVFNRCNYNHDDLLEYFRDNAEDSSIVGYMSAPWIPTARVGNSDLFYEETFKYFKAAIEKFYK